ncbi:conserved Plasmodium protein, unknown function [Plasmodium sp. DRC-Itaito]|nr:conserved Plasmodium protein, unknown function [Plasmodium sp. DRC-Itaito]
MASRFAVNIKLLTCIVKKKKNRTLPFFIKCYIHNIPRINTMKHMNISDVRRTVEVCSKKNIKEKNVWSNFLYIIILKLFNKEIKNYVDFMIILKLLSKYIKIEKKVLLFICEQIEHEIYKFTIRDLTLLILLLRKNNFENIYYINIISKSILMKMNKNMSYKDLALITYSLNNNITLTDEQIYNKEIFNFSIFKFDKHLNNLNFHSLSLFFYSYSLYFINQYYYYYNYNYNHFHSLFYMITKFINIINKNIHLYNSTDLMFIYIASLHLQNVYTHNHMHQNKETKSILTPNNQTKDHKYIDHNHNVSLNVNNNCYDNKMGIHNYIITTNINNNEYNKDIHHVDTNLKEAHINNEHVIEIKNNEKENKLITYNNSKYNLPQHIYERNMLTYDHSPINNTSNNNTKQFKTYDNKPVQDFQHNVIIQQGDEKNENIIKNLIINIKKQIEEKLSSFKIQEIVNILFVSLNKNIIINKKYFHFLNKDKINIQNYINIYVNINKIHLNHEEQNNSHYYILKIKNDNNKKGLSSYQDHFKFIYNLMNEIIYRNDLLNMKQIILLLYSLKFNNFMFIQFEKIILKRFICLPTKEIQKLGKEEIIFLYQYLYVRTCLFNELKKQNNIIISQDEHENYIYISEKYNDSSKIDNSYNTPNSITNNNSNYLHNNDNTSVYIHDDLFYMKNKHKRDRYKIYSYDNFIFNYPAYVEQKKDHNDHNEYVYNFDNMKSFIQLKKKKINNHNNNNNNNNNNYHINHNNNMCTYKNIQMEKKNYSYKHNNVIKNEINNIYYNPIISNQHTNDHMILKNPFFHNKKKLNVMDTINFEYELTCYNLYLDIYKIVCLKLLNFLKDKKLSYLQSIDILCIYEKLNIRDYRIIKYLYYLKKNVLYLDNTYLFKIINVIVKFNLYNMISYLQIHKILTFINYNNINESIQILKLIGMIISVHKNKKSSPFHINHLIIKNAANYLFKNLYKLQNIQDLKKIEMMNVYDNLTFKLYKLFKNILSTNKERYLKNWNPYDKYEINTHTNNLKQNGQDKYIIQNYNNINNINNNNINNINRDFYDHINGDYHYYDHINDNGDGDYYYDYYLNKSGKNMENINVQNLDDINITKIKGASHDIKKDKIKDIGYMRVKKYSELLKSMKMMNSDEHVFNEYRNVCDEIYEDLFFIYNKNIQVYKNINICNYTFPMAINLLTLNNDENIPININKNDDDDDNNKLIKVDKKKFLIVDILYNYDFYYTLTDTKIDQLKEYNIYLSYYSNHIKKKNKKILNYKKYALLKLMKKRGFNYICIDADTYVKNKKGKSKNISYEINKLYINNLILDILKRQKKCYSFPKNRLTKQMNHINTKNTLLLYHKNKKCLKKIIQFKNYKYKIMNLPHQLNYHNKRIKYIKNKTLRINERTKNIIEKEKVSTSNHLSKLKKMFTL